MNEHFLTWIEIEQFKCFKDFKASGFKRVNLIGGKNNIGKTSLMEACYINISGRTISHLITSIISTKLNREYTNYIFKSSEGFLSLGNKWLDSVGNCNIKSNLESQIFFIEDKDGKKNYQFKLNKVENLINSNELNISFQISNNINFIDIYSWGNKKLNLSFKAIQEKDRENELNSFVKEFDNSIENFKVIGDKPQCKTNGVYRDITEFGDGLKHYISIICALYACENGYLFIDEIDNGIYYENFDRLWEIILKLSKETNCQVFATTHSKEMLESFARVAKKLDEQDISYTLLVKNKKQEIKSITYDFEMILDSISDGRELRG
jgi:AAA15 family ATPase/GTPase